MWFWPRKEEGSSPQAAVPDDVRAGKPSPEGWGEPYALFSLGDDCTIDHFNSQSLVFDITLW